MLREYHGDGNWSCKDAAGMEFVFAGKPAGHLINLADDKNSGASVRILGKLLREISYVAVKYVVGSWFCCKKKTFRRWSTAVRVASEVLGYGRWGSD